LSSASLFIRYSLSKQTRRTGKRKYRVGSLQPVTETWFQKPQFYIRITRHYRQRLGDVSSEEAEKEGYRTIDEFKAVWIKLHGTWNPELIADAYEFKIAKKGGKPMAQLDCDH